jgi:D-alanine-D-alanine ligase
VTLPDRIRLVVLFGGRSAEHEISCSSAANVVRALDPDRYAVELVGIDQSGTWHRAEAAEALLARGPASMPAALPLEGPVVGREVALRPAGAGVDPDVPTVVFPVLHGPNGEDGTVQGFLELLDVAYVGSGVLGSALCMDKAAAKTVLDAHHIPQCRWLQVDRSVLDDAAHRAVVLSRLGQKVFVKPANLGSSVGISVCSGDDELLEGLREAFRYDRVVVVEEALSVRELETAVLGPAEDLRVSTVGEVIPAADAPFYDYTAKYLSDSSQTEVPGDSSQTEVPGDSSQTEVPGDSSQTGVPGDSSRTEVPADVPHDVIEGARSLAVQAARALRVEGMARVDLFLTDDDRLLVNEVNTIPGFTNISMYPELWGASGVGYRELIDELVALALRRHADLAQLQRSRTDGAQ